MFSFTQDSFEYLRPPLSLVESTLKTISEVIPESSAEVDAPTLNACDIFFTNHRISRRKTIHDRCLFYNIASYLMEEKLELQHWLDALANRNIITHPMIGLEEIFRLTSRAFIEDKFDDGTGKDRRTDLVKNYNAFFSGMNWNLTRKQMDLLKNQLVGILGRDKQGCPLIYICLREISKDNVYEYGDLIAKMCALVKSKMLIPGIIEQFSLVLDSEGEHPKISQSQLIMDCMDKSKLFQNNIKWVYNLRITWQYSIGISAFSVAGFLKPGDMEKIIKLKAGELGQLADTIDSDQLPGFLGGTKQSSQVWPPVIANGNLELCVKSKIKGLGLGEFLYPCDLSNEEMIAVHLEKEKRKNNMGQTLGSELWNEKKHKVMQKYITMEIDQKQAALWGDDAGRAVNKTVIHAGERLNPEEMMLNELEKMDENRRRKIRELRRTTKKTMFKSGKEFVFFNNLWCCGRD
jgi:hypothetical protein